jgi:type IV pilus assembly protein PilF
MRFLPVTVVAAGTLLLLAACASAPETPQQGRAGMDRVSPVRSAEVHTRLGLGYFERGQLQIAMENLEIALRHDPQHTPAHVTLALIHERLGNTRQADHHYRQASRFAPNDGATQNAYAVFLCRSGQYEEAQQRFERAIDDPFYTTPEVVFSNAGACALRNNRPEDAERYLRQAIEIAPDFPDPLFQLAELSLDRGDLLRARAFLQRFESEANINPVSLKLGYLIESALNNPHEAERYAGRLETAFPDSPEARELRSLRRYDE